MSCSNCDCLDCGRIRGINRTMNDIDDEDEGRIPPIHRPSWSEVEPPNEAQAKAWMGLIEDVFIKNKVTIIPMPTLISIVAQGVPGLRAENFYVVTAGIERLIRESSAFELRKGKNGGVFRKASFVGSNAQTAGGLGSSVSIAAVNNHTCPGCGNTACSKDEKSCWKCGGSL